MTWQCLTCSARITADERPVCHCGGPMRADPPPTRGTLTFTVGQSNGRLVPGPDPKTGR